MSSRSHELQAALDAARAAAEVIRAAYAREISVEWKADRSPVTEADVLAEEVIRTRLTEQIREVEGATYTPSVAYSHSLVWKGWGYLAASVEVPPEKLPGFFDEVAKITADLKAHPVTADELARAKEPRVQNLQKARVTNQYWLAELSGAQADPRRLQLVRETVPGTAKVTAADVQAAAQEFLRDDRAFRVEVRPTRTEQASR